MRASEWVFGRSTVEHFGYLAKQRKLNEAGRNAVLEARWVAAEYDWPGKHSADVPDSEAASLIWSAAFTSAGEHLQDSFVRQPVVDDPN
ncbi:MAG: hypothetical protein ABIQ18_29225 [Umezawaea sp.]